MVTSTSIVYRSHHNQMDLVFKIVGWIFKMENMMNDIDDNSKTLLSISDNIEKKSEMLAISVEVDD